MLTVKALAMETRERDREVVWCFRLRYDSFVIKVLERDTICFYTEYVRKD